MGEQETQTGTIRSQKHGNTTWLDVRNPASDTFAKLEKDYRLFPIHLTESVQKVQHTQVERETDYLFLVLHFPVFEPHTDEISSGQIGVFMGKDYLITIHQETSPFIDDLFVSCQHNEDQANSQFGQGPGYLLYNLIHRLLGGIASMTEIVENELDEIEKLVFENNSSDAQRIGRLRQQIVRLKRLIGPKRLLLQDLAEQVNGFTGQNMSRHYSSNVKLVNKLWEAIEEANETIEIYKDADFITSTEKTNEILAILTLVFTFTIPVTVVGTLYGMNIPMPGAITAAENWMFLGRYSTAILVVVISTLVAVAMYLYFKKKKWF